MPPPDSLPYRTLAQTKPSDICAKDDLGYLSTLWSEIDDLYRGGYAIQANAKRYLPALVGEHAKRHADRLRAAGYINYLGEIVDYFKSALFEDGISVVEASDADDESTPGGAAADRAFYDTFAHDCDLRGTPFSSLLTEAFVTAALKRKALIAIDFKRRSDAVPATRAEERAMGLDRAYAFDVPVDQLLDWEYDEDDVSTVQVGKQSVSTFGFAFVVLKKTVCRRAGPASSRETCVDEFRVWSRDDGVVRWDLYRTAPYKIGATPRPDEPVQRVAGDVTTFQRIPLLELVVTDGLWMGNKLGPLQREHYARRSSLVAAENRSLVAIPVAKLGPEIPAMGGALNSKQEDPNRGEDPVTKFEAMGYLAIGSEDDIMFAEPTGNAYRLVSEELAQLKDEMHRIVHQMAQSVDNSASTSRRSGASKREDRSAECKILSAYGELIRGLAKRVYETISLARGESVVWTVHGLSDYDADEDRATLLEEAVGVGSIAIPSATFRRAYMTRIAFGLLPGIEPETQKTIKDEIEAAITDEDAMPRVTAHDEPDGDEPAKAEPNPIAHDATPDAARPPTPARRAPAS